MYRGECRLLTSEFLVEITGVCAAILEDKDASVRVHCNLRLYTHNGREVWRRNAFIQDIVEVDVLEERMPLDVFGISLTRP